MGNLRAALDWAFGPGGERALGVRLVAAPAVQGAGLFGERELERHVRAALDAIDAGTVADPLDAARLHAALLSLQDLEMTAISHFFTSAS